VKIPDRHSTTICSSPERGLPANTHDAALVRVNLWRELGHRHMFKALCEIERVPFDWFTWYFQKATIHIGSGDVDQINHNIHYVN
jgi:hypothetical protein